MTTNITYRERERLTLDFGHPDRGVVEETFYPWVLTCRRFEEKVIEETPDYVIKQDVFGRQNIRRAGRDIETEYRPIIRDADDWKRMKEHAERELARHFTDAAIDAAYGPIKAAHERGDYSVRLNLEGFFWTPRELLGIEPHLYAFYDEPELLHDMCDYILDVYLRYLPRVLDIARPDVVYMMEDMSGCNGPMISNDFLDEFVCDYYRRLFPMLRAHGVDNVFVDTDGDFMAAIPTFLAAGVDGFLPMDVNAGMDIVKVREKFPRLKIIGGYNKLLIEEGPVAIDREFARPAGRLHRRCRSPSSALGLAGELPLLHPPSRRGHGPVRRGQHLTWQTKQE